MRRLSEHAKIAEMTSYTTTIPRSLGAIAAGIGGCAVVFSTVVVLVGAIDGGLRNIDWGWVAGSVTGSTFLVTLAVGAVICLVELPLWLVFHFIGLRHWLFALPLGGAVFFMAWFAPHTAWFSMPLAGDAGDGYGWEEAGRDSMMAALAGVALAAVMWRVAYRTAPATVSAHLSMTIFGDLAPDGRAGDRLV